MMSMYCLPERSFSTDEAISYLLSATQVVDDPNLTLTRNVTSFVYLKRQRIQSYADSGAVRWYYEFWPDADELPSRCGRGRPVVSRIQNLKVRMVSLLVVDGKNLFLQLEGWRWNPVDTDFFMK
jgi:hypothetical protein